MSQSNWRLRIGGSALDEGSGFAAPFSSLASWRSALPGRAGLQAAGRSASASERGGRRRERRGRIAICRCSETVLRAVVP